MGLGMVTAHQCLVVLGFDLSTTSKGGLPTGGVFPPAVRRSHRRRSAFDLGLLAVLSLCCGSQAWAQESRHSQTIEFNAPTVSTAERSSKVDRVYRAQDYQVQRARIRDGESVADFTALRLGFIQTPAYLALMSEAQLLNQDMFKAMDKDDFETCIDLADRALSVDFTSIHSHYGAMVCNIQLGNIEQGNHHQWILQGLVESLRQSGNGRDPNRPFKAISDEEVTGFLRLMGFEVQQKVSTMKDGVPLQVVTVRDIKAGQRQQLFFDTSYYFDDSMDQS